MQKRQGIVLKRFIPKKAKLSVLDRKVGKIDCIPYIDTLCNGAVITYYGTMVHRIYQLTAVELMMVPFDLGRTDIQFLHHVLEICYYFIPIHSPAPDIFDLLLFLYTIKNNTLHNAQFRKFFLCKLFAVLGFVPDDKKFCHPIIHKVVTTSIDRLSKLAIESEIELLLDQWIQRCITLHPRVCSFKTISQIK